MNLCDIVLNYLADNEKGMQRASKRLSGAEMVAPGNAGAVFAIDVVKTASGSGKRGLKCPRRGASHREDWRGGAGRGVTIGGGFPYYGIRNGTSSPRMLLP